MGYVYEVGTDGCGVPPSNPIFQWDLTGTIPAVLSRSEFAPRWTDVMAVSWDKTAFWLTNVVSATTRLLDVTQMFEQTERRRPRPDLEERRPGARQGQAGAHATGGTPCSAEERAPAPPSSDNLSPALPPSLPTPQKGGRPAITQNT